MAILTPADLAPFADIDPVKAEAMIADAEAKAALAAPCITDPEFQADAVLVAALVAVLRGAVLRWHDSGTGALQQFGAGSFQGSLDTRQPRRGMFWPSEIADLRDLCARFGGATDATAFSIDTAPTMSSGGHVPWCNLLMDGGYCSCGASLTRGEYPLWELP